MFLLQILETLFIMEERKKKRSTCSVMRFLLGRRASQLGCHTLHKQVDAERSQRDAQPWSGASQVIADEGMLAIRIPGREERSLGNRRLATAIESVQRQPCWASTLVMLCPKQTTREARSTFLSFALLCPDVSFQANTFRVSDWERDPDWTFIHQRPTKDG